MVLQYRSKRAEDAAFPINEGSIAVEGEEFELAEVKGHGLFRLRIAFSTQHSIPTQAGQFTTETQRHQGN